MRDIERLNAEKNRLRAFYKAERRALSKTEKAKLDASVARNVLALSAYQKADYLLAYASAPIEVSTVQIVNTALKEGKTVAFPRCVPGTRQMEFYKVQSFADLESGAFGILEPKAQKENLLKDFQNALCLVPALCYDKNGYRLGYGKGYYDRFLPCFSGETVGLTYENCFLDALLHGEHDCAVQTVITEQRVLKI